MSAHGRHKGVHTCTQTNCMIQIDRRKELHAETSHLCTSMPAHTVRHTSAHSLRKVHALQEEGAARRRAAAPLCIHLGPFRHPAEQQGPAELRSHHRQLIRRRPHLCIHACIAHAHTLFAGQAPQAASLRDEQPQVLYTLLRCSSMQPSGCKSWTWWCRTAAACSSMCVLYNVEPQRI